MDADGFDISVVDDTLVVRGEKQVERESRQGRYHRMECAYGSFERRIPLDADAMHEAAQQLLGKHDFTTFRAAECQAKSPEKTLDQLDVVRDGNDVSVITSARTGWVIQVLLPVTL